MVYISNESPVGLILEFKYTQELKELDKYAQVALDQINDNKYLEFFNTQGGIQKVYCYGISFCKRNCKLVVQEVDL